MYKRKDKSRYFRWAAWFFAGMVLFTLLSRAAWQHGTAVVTTAAPTEGSISHRVSLTGKAVQNQELAVTTVSGLRVAAVLVNEGQRVAKEEVLFTLDLDYLSQTILTQEKELQKQKLTVQDAWSQTYASQEQRANRKAQAEENYQSAVSQGQTALDRAQRDLDRAKNALENFYTGAGEDQAQKEALEQAYKDAQADQAAAQTALETLRQEIEAQVQQALEQARQEQTPAPPAPEPEEGQEEPSDPVSEGPTQEELDIIAQQVRDSYAQRLAEAQARLDQANQALSQAQADLDSQPVEPSAATEQELLDAVEQAQERYDDALFALENAKTVYGRSVSSANLPDSSNHTAQIGQITCDQMAMSLEKLEALMEQNGEIRSPVDGVVTGCYVRTGEKTTDSAALLLADLGQGCKFTGVVSQEQSEYIGVGDKVTLQASGTGKRYEDLPVTTFSAAQEADGGYRLTVQLPENSLALGASAELSFTRRSQPYRCCVPLSALHLDAQNRPYVLVAEPAESVLGSVLSARKVSVTVLEHNDTVAALAEGTVSGSQQVIVGADRAVDAGSRVRVE